jgi:LacI family transcriptional regulator
MAFGAMDAARSAGLEVPKDLSVVGFDDMRGADTATPPLTTVRQPLFQLGKVAAEHILKAISGDDVPPVREKLSAQLIVRSSTAPRAAKERA